MNAQGSFSMSRRSLAVAALAIVVPLSSAAVEGSPPDSASVQVLPDAYVAGGQSFSSLTALAAWAASGRSRSLALDGCGPGATPQLLAAVERLHGVYTEGVRIRTFAAGEPACVAAARSASGQARTPLPYYEGDRSGRVAVH